MFERDNSKSAVQAAAEQVKRENSLQTENQKQPESGHKSADYGSGGPSAAGPKGSPGTGNSGGNSRMSY